MLGVLPGRVQCWVEEQMLLTKGGRITESSLSKFLSDFPEKIPYESLSPETRSWLFVKWDIRPNERIRKRQVQPSG